jgi:phosphoglycerate dehydrogenase-like enzyme
VRSVVAISGPHPDREFVDALKAIGQSVKAIDIERDGWKALDGCWAHVLGGAEVLDESSVEQLPQSVELVCFLGTGYESYMDVAALERRQIRACYTPHANAVATAEFAVGMLIMGMRAIPKGIDQIARCQWNPPEGRSLFGSAIGVVGFGHVGREVVGILNRAFGVVPLVWNRTDKASSIRDAGGQPADLESIFASCSGVTLHANIATTAEPLVTEDLLLRTPQGFVLVNTARAATIDSTALMRVLSERKDISVLADVYPSEPVCLSTDDLGLLSLGLDRFTLTPHMAYSSNESARKTEEMVLANLSSFLASGSVVYPASV